MLLADNVYSIVACASLLMYFKGKAHFRLILEVHRPKYIIIRRVVGCGYIVLTSKTVGVLCGTDSFVRSFIFVRNKTYPLEWDYSVRNLIVGNAFIGEVKFSYAL